MRGDLNPSSFILHPFRLPPPISPPSVPGPRRGRPRGGRGGEGGRSGHEARVPRALEAYSRVALDVGQVGLFLVRHEGERVARGFGAASAADAVDVILGLVGRVEVDDVRDAV